MTKPPLMAALADVQLARVENHAFPEAVLSVFEDGQNLPFALTRVFTVHAHQPVQRGHHAHRQCGQVLICLAGACTVTVDDGKERKSMTLTDPAEAVYVPPSIWGEQEYLEPGTILLVLCDRIYEEDDYIRDYEDFLSYRGNATE